MPHVLALDFDGVISDSLLEAYLLTWRIAGKLDPELAVAAGRVPDPDNIHSFRDENREHWESFSPLVPFGNRAEDYLVIQRAVHQGMVIATQEQFDSYRKAFDTEQLDQFHEEFYRERGYPFVAVQGKAKYSADGVAVRFVVNKGNYTIIN